MLLSARELGKTPSAGPVRRAGGAEYRFFISTCSVIATVPQDVLMLPDQKIRPPIRRVAYLARVAHQLAHSSSDQLISRLLADLVASQLRHYINRVSINGGIAGTSKKAV